jgi:hypothetical protein
MSAASGEFHHDGWHIRQPHEDVRTTQFASAHESHHKQLQDSTSYGAVARVYHELGAATGNGRFAALARDLTAASRIMQEGFASWLPAAALGWTRAQLLQHYPSYVPYYDALEALVKPVPGPYLRVHAAHTVARACLQTTAIDTALAVGLDAFTMAQLRDRDLPDARGAQLKRHPPDWGPAIAALTAEAEEDNTLRALLAARTLSADLFNPDFNDVWQRVNQVMYDQVAAALRERGLATLELDGHLERTQALVAEAEQLRAGLGIQAGHPRRRAEVLGVVLGNIEAETFSVAPPLDARIQPVDTPPEAMIADLELPHLFITVRRTAALLANYTLVAGQPPDAPVGGFARRTIALDDGRRVVELLPVPAEAHRQYLALAVPLVTVVPMSLLAQPDWAGWMSGPSLHRAVLLADVPLAPYLAAWLSQPDSRFRHVFLRIESFGRVVPFLVATVEMGGATAWPLLVRPLSHAGVGVHQAAFDELLPEPARDGGFLDEQRELLEMSLAHLAGEEVVFGPGTAAGTHEPMWMSPWR